MIVWIIVALVVIDFLCGMACAAVGMEERNFRVVMAFVVLLNMLTVAAGCLASA